MAWDIPPIPQPSNPLAKAASPSGRTCGASCSPILRKSLRDLHNIVVYKEASRAYALLKHELQ